MLKRARTTAAATDRRALAAARESGRRHSEGRPLGPLDGVPVLVKDQLDQRGLPTRVGTRFLGRQPATRDAAAVARLRAAGAVMLGKTRMHELGNGVTGLNAGRETPRNPHDPRRYTGGSSSGSAAAVAAGLCPLALGTDGGGSIRVPAALCGVVGLKPTFGRVDGRGAYPLAWSVGHIGPIAASVRDAALGYHALTGALTRPGDVGRRASAEGARVGVYRPWFEHAAPEVVRACEAALSRLAARGAVIRELALPDLELALTAHLVTISSELRSALGRCSRRDRGAIGLDVRLNLAITAGLTGADYVAAQRLRARFTAGFRERLREVDVIATPTTGIVAPVIRADALAGGESDLSTILALIRFTAQANLTGFPALSVPVGFVGAAPVGLQLIAAPWREQAALELGALVERDAERRAPQVYADVLGAAAAAAARVLPSRGGTARSGAA